ncbi:hypothetical protein LIER_07987 [Lithospermum erythrorhizon]|uniref:Enamelin n=1 Tax=Lithospermum erythrorhizon TaxID=34254 RepID=A0AAV3PBW7_LITER
MNGNNKKVHATKISQQLHKNISERGPDTIQQVAAVPARGYITYSSHERIDHFGDGQFQTQRRYGSSTEDIMPRDYFGSYNNQANYSSNDYRSDDPVFDEFLSSLMKSFEGYGNPNIVGYRTEFAPPVGYYNDPYFTNMRNNRSAFTSTAQVHDTFSRPDSPSRRRASSLSPENGPWLPGPRASGGRYAEHQYAQPRFGPFDPTRQTKFNYPDSSVRINDVRPRTGWYAGPGKQRSEFGYNDHHCAPPDPTNQTQIPNTPPQRNSPHPVLSTRFEDGKLPNAGGHGYSPSGEVDYVRNSPNEGYNNYSYAPPAPMAPRDSLTNPEMETSWDIKVNTQPNTGEKISNMATGALNFAKKNLYPPPEMANRWQFSNQPKLEEKSSTNGSLDLGNTSQQTVPATQEGNTRPELYRISSQGKGTAFPEMAKTWLSKQLNTGEKNPHNETSDFPQPTQFPTSASQENENTRPEFSKSASRGKGNAFPEMAKSWFSKQPNTWGKNPHNETSGFPQPTQFPTPASQDDGNTRPEFSRSASRGNASPEMENRWEITNQPNNGETYSNALVRDSSRRSQVLPDSQERRNGSLEASNGSQINKQPNITEKISKFGALNRKSQFPALFSREKGNVRT